MDRNDVDLLLVRLEDAQGVLASWLEPDGATDDEARRRLLSILDDRHLVAAMRRLRPAPAPAAA